MPERMRGVLAACLLATACSSSDRSSKNTSADSAASPPAGGHVFVSNEGSGTITILEPQTDSAVATIPVGTRPRGIRVSADGRTVYVADYSHGILRVDLASRTASRLEDAPWSTSLGCDGIVWHRQSLIAIQNGVAPPRIMRFALDSTGTAITRAEVIDRNSAIADSPTIGALMRDTLVYVANSQWERYDDTGARVPGTTLSAPVLLALPLR